MSPTYFDVMDTARASGRLTAARRHYPSQDHTDLEQDLATARILNYARKVLGDGPGLSEGHVAILTTALRGEVLR
ncbi:hypothetical protein [Corynebacterium halotolerans]|uniref:Uncharacterized protein n=1 Tax=Corynebacterium halotolerans YIM 70093 = DSM 44683 TaxID=1121362 RepID=M1MV30_9CORY|nr:hypothetical protein [Corynebacterium halotolerans]AGF71574.1 hypothetical protein A605_02800 [Corynebacterium halotolerans YIM 70093 = DSM 44683]